MTIGESLKRFRDEFHLTQDEVADVLKVTRQAYHSYERDKANPPSKKILELADVYDVSTDYLLGRSDEPHPTKFDKAEVQKAFAIRDMFQSMMAKVAAEVGTSAQ